jgi:hypothetical protein
MPMDMLIIRSHSGKKDNGRSHDFRSFEGSEIQPKTSLYAGDLAIVQQNLEHTMLGVSDSVFEEDQLSIPACPVVSVLSDQSKRLQGGFADTRGFYGMDLSRVKFS